MYCWREKIYCTGLVKGEDSFLVFKPRFKAGKRVDVALKGYYYQVLYNDGYIYALRKEAVEHEFYTIEKRSSTDFSLVDKYEIRSERNPKMGLNPYTRDLMGIVD